MPEIFSSLRDFISINSVGFSAGILILTYIFIATEKISKVTVAL